MAVQSDQYEIMSAVVFRLYTRHHLLTICPRTCTLPELSETELMFLCVKRFLDNIYHNGWDGYLSNTENEFGGFLVDALAAIGAHEMAAIAHEALWHEACFASLTEDEISQRKLKRPSDDAFFRCSDDLEELLFQFWRNHRDELPSAEPVTAEQANEFELERECLLDPERRSLPRFQCPRCRKIYISKKDDGECSRCRVHRIMHEACESRRNKSAAPDKQKESRG